MQTVLVRLACLETGSEALEPKIQDKHLHTAIPRHRLEVPQNTYVKQQCGKARRSANYKQIAYIVRMSKAKLVLSITKLSFAKKSLKDFTVRTHFLLRSNKKNQSGQVSAPFQVQ